MEDKLREFFKSGFPEAVVREDNFREQQSFFVKPEFLFDIMQGLYEDIDLNVKFLLDICALDWLDDPVEEKDGRFEVIYNMYSLKYKHRFFIKVRLPEDKPEVDSVTSIWQTANWLEREVYDLMGIHFIGHPNLTKIMTPDELEGHPHRKDFPLTYEVPQFSHNKDEPPEVIL